MGDEPLSVTIDDTNWKFPFGKHTGETIEDVFQLDPSYIVWWNDNIEEYTFSERIVEIAEELAAEDDN